MINNSQECYIDNKKILIEDFIKNKKLIKECKEGKKNIYDKDGNELIFCDGKIVKPYFRKLITNDNPMTKWHKEWQEEFEGYTEQKYEIENMNKKYRRADVDLNDTQIIEFQHSRMTREEALNRKNDYSKVNKEIIWVIDGNNYGENQNIMITELKHSNRTFIEFKNEEWKYESYIDYDVIYLNIGDNIYKINPSFVKSKMIDVQAPITKKVFCEKLKKGEKTFEDDIITQTTIYVSQQGAGNGKTFRATNLLSEHFNDTKYHHYDIFLYLTKQHSAKTVIHDEFIEKDENNNTSLKSKYLSNDFELVQKNNKYYFKLKNKSETKGKKYFINLKNKKTGKIYKIIIATIDSFIFALNSGIVRGIDKFMSMVNNIIDNNLEYKKSGHIKYAGGITLNKKMLLVGDEMQDLDENYVKAIIKICRNRYVDFYMVGDILQSIKTEKNSFTFISTVELPNTIKLIKTTPENKIMRFGDKELINFVNDIIPFEKYNLPKIEKHQDNKDVENSKLTIFEGNTIYADSKEKNTINLEVQKIMYYYKEEVEKNKCKPNDFLIVTPFTKKNPLVEALHLEIREFWKNYYKSDNYVHYSVFHKSEDGTTIDLDESTNSTRIVSIHTSKGDGRNVVFVIGLTEDGLKLYSDESNNLIYDSLLHVALTRMKKRLYIRFENNGDDICKKILKCNLENITSPYVDFTKNIELEKMLSKEIHKNYEICYELIIKHTKYKHFINKENTEKEIIDIKHHSIRAISSHILFLLSIANDVILNNKLNKNDFIPQQLFPLLKKCTTTNISTYTNTKDYNKSLFDKDNGEMPILMYDNLDHKKIYDELKNNIEKNKNTLNKLLKDGIDINHDVNVIESICLYHTLEVCENKFKSILPIADMYDIIDIYLKSSNDYKEEYKKYHYDKLGKIKNIYKKISDKYKKLQWFWSSYSEFNGKNSSIKLYSSHQFIALNQNDVIICKICPQFNELNYDKIIYDSIFEIFTLKNSKEEKFKNKKIIMCIISLDLNEPFYIDYENLLEDNKNILLCMMKKNLTSIYLIKNKGLYLLYNFYKKEFNNETPYELICKLVEELKKNNNPKKPYPEYALEFFDEIKVLVKTKKTQDKQKKILDDYDNEEHFMSEINFTMNESLNRFFGITDKDMEELDKIKLSNEKIIISNEDIILSNDKNFIHNLEIENKKIHKITKNKKIHKEKKNKSLFCGDNNIVK